MESRYSCTPDLAPDPPAVRGVAANSFSCRTPLPGGAGASLPRGLALLLPSAATEPSGCTRHTHPSPRGVEASAQQLGVCERTGKYCQAAERRNKRVLPLGTSAHQETVEWTACIYKHKPRERRPCSTVVGPMLATLQQSTCGVTWQQDTDTNPGRCEE